MALGTNYARIASAKRDMIVVMGMRYMKLGHTVAEARAEMKKYKNKPIEVIEARYNELVK